MAHYEKLERDLEADLKTVFDDKRDMNNKLQELKGNIRVYCRIRPYLKNEIEEEKSEMIKITNQGNLDLTVPQSVIKFLENLSTSI